MAPTLNISEQDFKERPTGSATGWLLKHVRLKTVIQIGSVCFGRCNEIYFLGKTKPEKSCTWV